ncbi:putative nucleoredoxin 1-1 [Sesamum alatum]|uniref:Nucleoredoxin 1-1 n=1 Tax=Sesamum alatum TaxID=300844 RepID=A0AAE1XWR0_9LAMI|nr:putative nucleoredoxin 1-1 [Sesamum alatum]
MAPLPKSSIVHFTHPAHTLTAVDDQRDYLCNGCKTLGNGKRYRCQRCDFDLHDYCGTCPRLLSSFMHKKHALSLVTRKAQGARQVDRICDVCRDPVEGLFYRCKECEFDVHPLCTQLPEKLQHALHKIHPLILQSSTVPGFCGVCGGSCSSWRYRCEVCNFDIHLECVLVPMVPCRQNERVSQERGVPMFDQGIPFQPPPQFGVPYGWPCGPGNNGYPLGPSGFNMQQNYQYMYPNNVMAQNQQVGGGSNIGTGRPRKSMFALVGQLGFGVLSNMIFGVDLSLFSGAGPWFQFWKGHCRRRFGKAGEKKCFGMTIFHTLPIDATALMTLQKPELLHDVASLLYHPRVHLPTDGYDNPLCPLKEGLDGFNWLMDLLIPPAQQLWWDYMSTRPEAGRFGLKLEGAGKVRTFAIPNPIFQTVVKAVA